MSEKSVEGEFFYRRILIMSRRGSIRVELWHENVNRNDLAYITCLRVFILLYRNQL